MSDIMTVNGVIKADGRNYQTSRVVTADGKVTKSPTIPAAKQGTLSARTDDDTGTVTGQNGHGIVSTDLVDVYWTGGRRYGMVATVTGNSIALDGGAGDNLPAATITVAFMKPQLETFEVAAADVLALVVGADTKNATAVFLSDAPATVLAARVTPDSDYVWDGSTSTPLGDDVVSVLLSHDDTIAPREVSAVAMVG